jgi:hypothetical protein
MITIEYLKQHPYVCLIDHYQNLNPNYGVLTTTSTDEPNPDIIVNWFECRVFNEYLNSCTMTDNLCLSYFNSSERVFDWRFYKTYQELLEDNVEYIL